MKQPTTNNQQLVFFKRLSRNTLLGNIIPYRIRNAVYGFFVKIGSRKKLLKKEILKYLENGMIYLDKNVKDSIDFLKKPWNKVDSINFMKIWLNCDNKDERYFDFNKAKLPDLSYDKAQMKQLASMFLDTFLFSCLLNDNYNKTIVERFDQFMAEGPYGYANDDFDVTIKKNDIVIDAGAWIGDFSAYAASKDATVYAFEPVSDTYNILVKTSLLNDKKIIPMKKALGDKNGEMEITFTAGFTTAASIFMLFQKHNKKETIEVTTLDEFVEKEKVKKVDFIKADIEGGERYLLLGAKKVLKEFGPKLAICTYHYPEDPELLEKIILDANPKYCVIHTRHKLFAMIKK